MIFRSNFNSENNGFKSENNYVVIILLALACFFYGLSSGINDSSFNYYLAGFNLDDSKVSSILNYELFGNIFSAPFILILVSRLGLYKALIFAIVLKNIFLLMFGSGVDSSIWYPAIFGFGLTGFIVFVGMYQWINSISEDYSRATYLSIISFSFGLGIVLGPYLVSTLNITSGKMVFITSFVCSSLMIIPILLAYKYRPLDYKHHKLSIFKLLKYAYVPIMCSISAEYIILALAKFLPIFAVTHGKLADDASMLGTYFTISGLLFTIPMGIMIDRFDRLGVVTIFSLMIAVTIQIVPIVMDNQILMLGTFAILSSAINGIIICSLAILGDRFKGDAFIIANIVVHTLSIVGGYAGEVTTGLAIDKLGSSGLIFSISALFLVSLALLLIESYKNNKK